MPAEILLYGEVGAPGCRAEDVRRALAVVGGEPVTVRINSAGGDVFEAIAIHGALRDYPGDVIAYVDGLAASAASVIAMAAREVVMAAGSYMMLHLPHVALTGRAEDLRRHASTLDGLGDTLARIYAGRSNQSLETVNGWLAEERWFRAEEAVAAGLADRVAEDAAAPMPFAASALTQFRHVPEKVVMMATKDGPGEAPAEAKARERIKGILEHEEANGREGLARFLALSTAMPVADAVAALAAAQKASAEPAPTPESYAEMRAAAAAGLAMPTPRPRMNGRRSWDDFVRGDD